MRGTGALRREEGGGSRKEAGSPWGSGGAGVVDCVAGTVSLQGMNCLLRWFEGSW